MKQVFFVLLLFFSTMIVSAQQTILLYPDGAPGLKPNTLIEKDVSEKKDGIIRLRNVSVPTLKLYKANKRKGTGASVIICPGGAYSILAYDHEGESVAEWFASKGVTAFVLKYRLPQEEMFTESSIRPLQDAQQAIIYVRKNASKYGISQDKIGMMGFSAGGHLAASAATKYNHIVGELTADEVSPKPDFSILIYPVISFNDKFGHLGSRNNLIGPDLSLEEIDANSNELLVDKNTPPTFLVHAFDDPVKIENSFAYASALKKAGVPVEFHAYEKGGHGFSMTKNGRGPVESWPDRLADWMINNGWML